MSIDNNEWEGKRRDGFKGKERAKARECESLDLRSLGNSRKIARGRTIISS